MSDLLLWCLKERADIKAIELGLAARKEAANTVIRQEMAKLEITSFSDETVGTLTVKAGGMVKSLDKKRLISGMLAAKLDANQVKSIIDLATNENRRAGSIDFRLPGEKAEESHA